MGSIVVLFEVEPGQALGPDGVEPAVRAVHAAGADPDVPEDPQPRTLCGLDTSGMEHAHYRPLRPGEPWYPPRWPTGGATSASGPYGPCDTGRSRRGRQYPADPLGAAEGR